MESPEVRRRTMQAVKSKDTSPEIKVRRLVHAMGYRFRLYRKDLPGKPDLVFPRLRKIIFVHGCFWHGHTCLRGARVPGHNRAYWTEKIARNRRRDKNVGAALSKLGWDVCVLWECQLKDTEQTARGLRDFLENMK